MRLSDNAPRILAAAAAFATLVAAAPASAQADLAVVFVADPATSTATDIVPGVETTFETTITNGGPNAATAVEFRTTAIPTGSEVTGTSSNCSNTAAATEHGQAGVICQLGDILHEEKVTVTFKVLTQIPDPLPAVCPDPNSLGAATVTVASTATTAPATPATSDPTPANNTATRSVRAAPYADVAVTFTAPPTANVGDTVAYDATVKNNGPCPAEGVFLETTPTSLLEYQSGTGVCPTDDGCDIGTLVGVLAPNQSVAFRRSYKVLSPPSSVNSTGNPNNIAACSIKAHADPDTATCGNGSDLTADPDDGNNTETTTTLVQTSSSGCSSAGGGAGWLASALLAGLAVRRRRRA